MLIKNWQKIKVDRSRLRAYKTRELTIDAVRTFFKEQDFWEVETPLLVEKPSTETFLDFFSSELRTADGLRRSGFLTTSPEYAMKKILAAGLPNIFQVCKSFRNGEGVSSRHNPEFSILEWYRTEADYTDIMTDCEELFEFCVAMTRENQGKPEWIDAESSMFEYQGRKYNLARPWPRLTVAEAFAQFAAISTEVLLDEAKLRAAAQDKGYSVDSDTTWEEAYNQIFLNEIEPRIAEFDRPVFLCDYPVSQAALSRKKPSDPRFAERFEWYLGGIELGNAFSELLDPVEQEARLRSDLALRKAENRPPYEIDQDFIEALKSGFPPTGGIAVGVDRLVMLMADVPSIKDTLFFPVEDVFQLEY